MKTPWKALRYAAGLLAAALLAGCATPASRIEKDPAAFSALPPDMQAAVRDGRIAIGFPPDAVRLALGKPDRRYMRDDAAGQTEVWSYVGYRYSRTSTVSFWPAYVYDYDRCGRRHYSYPWVDVEYRDEFERLRVEFRAGKVSAVEHLAR